MGTPSVNELKMKIHYSVFPLDSPNMALNDQAIDQLVYISTSSRLHIDPPSSVLKSPISPITD
jgi:hypothetical protein